MLNQDGNEGQNQGVLHGFTPQFTHPRSEQMMGEIRGGDGDISRGGEAVLELLHGGQGDISRGVVFYSSEVESA